MTTALPRGLGGDGSGGSSPAGGGSTIHTIGTSPPAPELGKQGDFAILASSAESAEIWEKITSTEWLKLTAATRVTAIAADPDDDEIHGIRIGDTGWRIPAGGTVLSLISSETVTMPANTNRWAPLAQNTAGLPDWFYMHVEPPDGTGDYILVRKSDLTGLPDQAAGETASTSTGIRIPDAVGGGSDLWLGHTAAGGVLVALSANSFTGQDETFQFFSGSAVAATAPLSDTAPAADGTAAAGTATTASRSDHVHPSAAASAALIFTSTSAGLQTGLWPLLGDLVMIHLSATNNNGDADDRFPLVPRAVLDFGAGLTLHVAGRSTGSVSIVREAADSDDVRVSTAGASLTAISFYLLAA